MKKIILLSALLVLSLAACGNSEQNNTENAPAENQTAISTSEPVDDSAESTESNTATEDTADAVNGNILIAYFSVMETDGVDTAAGASRVAVNGEVLGNNQYIAQIIQQETREICFPSKRYRNILRHMNLSWSLLMKKKPIMQDRSL